MWPIVALVCLVGGFSPPFFLLSHPVLLPVCSILEEHCLPHWHCARAGLGADFGGQGGDSSSPMVSSPSQPFRRVKVEEKMSRNAVQEGVWSWRVNVVAVGIPRGGSRRAACEGTPGTPGEGPQGYIPLFFSYSTSPKNFCCFFWGTSISLQLRCRGWSAAGDICCCKKAVLRSSRRGELGNEVHAEQELRDTRAGSPCPRRQR